MAKYVIGSGDLVKTAKKKLPMASPINPGMSQEEFIQKCLDDPDFFKRAVGQLATQRDIHNMSVATHRKDVARFNLAKEREAEKFKRLDTLDKEKENFANRQRDAIFKQEANAHYNAELQKAKNAYDRLVNTYAGGNAAELENMAKGYGQMKSRNEALEEAAKMSKAVDSDALKKIFTPRRLAIGAGATALGAAGLYGLHRLTRNRDGYEFLDR